ncbi:hypothetical protein [uncultured Sutterella sp.]|uniref:hypothetical protein n=1 Tax=uncultured Sutterella sp. TaxID=286133 RepID=UPI0026709798|nr:hypothetical protein [uncultured Sutterella sp.]
MKSDRLQNLFKEKCQLLDEAQKIFEEIFEMANPDGIEYSGDVESLNNVILKNIYPLYQLQIRLFKVEEAYLEESLKNHHKPQT